MRKNETIIRITNKGRAFVAAFEAGLIPKTENGYDEMQFEKFWDEFEKEMDRCEYCPANRLKDRPHLPMCVSAIVMAVAAIILSIVQLLK